VIPLNIRFSREQVGQLDEGVFEVFRGKVRFESCAALPLLD
jgi:hypothetical protein